MLRRPRAPPLFGLSGWLRTEVNEGGAEEAGVEPTEDACAPSNGFEARAPHRERYSSKGENDAISPATKEASAIGQICQKVSRCKECLNHRGIKPVSGTNRKDMSR